MARQPPEQQAPPVQRLRIRYAKRGRLRFASHRDFARAFERALVRARVPMAYSSGFSPHPRISYAGAAPTGAASEAEYLEIGLASRVEPYDVRVALDAVLPDGLDVLEVVESVPGRDPALADRLQASRWRAVLTGVDRPALAAAVHRFLEAPEVTVQRMTKRGLRDVDARAAVAALAVDPDHAEVAEHPAAGADCAILAMVLRHGTPSVRPDDVLAGLRAWCGLDAAAVVFSRLAQGPWDERTGTVGDPLVPDRDAR